MRPSAYNCTSIQLCIQVFIIWTLVILFITKEINFVLHNDDKITYTKYRMMLSNLKKNQKNCINVNTRLRLTRFSSRSPYYVPYYNF